MILLAKGVCSACTFVKESLLDFTASVEAEQVEKTEEKISNGELEINSYYVGRGDTLWSIAEELTSTENVDVRDIVYQIKLVNKSQGVNTNTLYEGQEIFVPSVDSLVK